MRDEKGRFLKGHVCLKGSEKGWFKKNSIPWDKGISWSRKLQKNEKIKSFCNYCKKPIEFYRQYLKLRHHFCNKKCCSLFHTKKVFFSCFQCKKKIIFRTPSNLKHSKTKHYFCSKNCKDEWMKTYRRGEEHSNWKCQKRKCKICGKYFFRAPSHDPITKTDFFCSNKCYGDSLKIKYKKSGNPMWSGGPKIIRCVECKKEIHRNESEIKKALLYFCSIKCRVNHMRGLQSPHWKNGISKLPYSFEFNDKLRQEIRTRDEYKCQLCGITEEEHIVIHGEVLTVHHINYDKMNYSKDSLIALCKQCNSRVNFNRDFWSDFFQGRLLSLNKEH